jgi:hypothetical protein
MGISLEGETTDMVLKSFSDDVLKIELSGPDYEHFSVVDLPGLFRSMFSTRVGNHPERDSAIARFRSDE